MQVLEKTRLNITKRKKGNEIKKKNHIFYSKIRRNINILNQQKILRNKMAWRVFNFSIQHLFHSSFKE